MANETLVMRADRKMFMGVKDSSGSAVTYTRLKGFTTLSESKTRQNILASMLMNTLRQQILREYLHRMTLPLI